MSQSIGSVDVSGSPVPNRFDLMRCDGMRYSLAATRSASGTATLAAPIIRRMELTASQCLAASNPASIFQDGQDEMILEVWWRHQHS